MPPSISPKRNLLIAFDAFGTLFSPRGSVLSQYLEVAKSLGIRNLRVEQLEPQFRKEFKELSSKYPNYGKRDGMHPDTWWTSIITGTFTPFLSDSQKPVLKHLVPALLKHFSSSAGYHLHSDARQLLASLQQSPSAPPIPGRQESNMIWNRTVVGVISNSDPRVPSVLESFGLKIGSPRANEYDPYQPKQERSDIQFVVLSYHAGVEKPNSQIFQMAEELARTSCFPPEEDHVELVKLYVGDDFEKDGIAAARATWHAMLVDRDDKLKSKFEHDFLHVNPNSTTKMSAMTIERVSSLWPWKSRLLQSYESR